MNNEEPQQRPGRPPIDGESKDDRLVIRTQSWRVGGVRKAAKKAKVTVAKFVEDAVDEACRKQGVAMPPK